MILGLTAPLTEKSTYQNPSQRDAWGSFCYSIILPDYSQESFWRTYFPKRKEDIDTGPVIPDREGLP